MGSRAMLLHKGYTSKELDEDLRIEDGLLIILTQSAIDTRQTKILSNAVAEGIAKVF